jgi:oligoribonuclease
MSKKGGLLWVDLEMTGLDPIEDRILEVAAIVTDWSFREIASFTAAVKVPVTLAERRMTGEFWEKNKKAREDLLRQNENGIPSKKVEQQLMAFVKKHCGKEVYLAGNSIHQDRKFIEKEWKELNKTLHYRMLDVSAFKIYFAHKSRKKFMKPEKHRALDDIRGSIEEMKWYSTMIS